MIVNIQYQNKSQRKKLTTTNYPTNKQKKKQTKKQTNKKHNR